MPRKGQAERRDVMADPIYNSKLVTRLINRLMLDGKKGTAQQILYKAFETIAERSGRDAMEVFEEAMNNIMPVLEVKARRVGGANYQVPVEVRPERRTTLALRYLVNYSRLRNEKTMDARLLTKSWTLQTTLVLLLRSAKICTKWRKRTKRLLTTAGNSENHHLMHAIFNGIMGWLSGIVMTCGNTRPLN